MPKQKTHRGARKRFKVSGTGKIRRANSMRNHILTKKTTKRKRQLRRKSELGGKFAKQVRALIQQG